MTLFLSASSLADAQGFDLLGGFSKTVDSFSKAKDVSMGGEASSVDDLSYKAFNVNYFPDNFIKNRMGEMHTAVIKCVVRVKDPNFGSVVQGTRDWFQGTFRQILGQPPVPAMDPEYGETSAILPQYVAQFKYKIVVDYGRVVLSEMGDKISDESEYLATLALQQTDRQVHPDWDAKIAANAGPVKNVGTRIKNITKVNMGVRLTWGGAKASWLNRAGDYTMLREYALFGNGRVDDAWTSDADNEKVAKKRGVSWKCTDQIEIGYRSKVAP